MVVIQTESGKIRGKLGLDVRDKKFYIFQNIPYAEPPVGKLRFKAPQPVKPWEGIRDATTPGPESISRDFLTKKIVGSEDCLHLNVYTPELPQKNRLKPVMFYIHGGVFMTGSNRPELLGPEFLMTEDVVLVVINYRLGILGFLSLDDSSLGVPGNAGFKDMVLALKWVQKNIAYFCGDPNNVTVFGESAGAAAAHLLMLSPMTKGLMHRVIAQSASALNTWVLGRRSAQIIAKELGFINTDDRKLLAFLQEVPAKQLLEAQNKINTYDFVENELRFFGVIAERPSNEEAFLSRRPVDIILSGEYNHVPLMIGYNEREGMFIDDGIPVRARTTFFENLELSVPLTLNIERGSELSKQIAKEIHQHYFNGVDYNRKDHLKEYYDMTTDTVFSRDIYFSVKHHIKTSTKPIYYYKFILETELNIYKKITGATLPGLYHGDDLGYIFKTIFTPEITSGSAEDIAQKRVTKLWANFARFGNPTPDPTDGLLKVIWEPVTKDKLKYLEIGDKLEMKVNPAPRLAFWDKVVAKL